MTAVVDVTVVVVVWMLVGATVAGAGLVGIKSGPFCPQAASSRGKVATMPQSTRRDKIKVCFTITITVYRNALECSMTETEFLDLAERTLGDIERVLESAAESADLDIECSRAGNVLEIELIDADSKIIINSQAPMQEIWVAARSGGFHYKRSADRWLDTRNGEELFTALERLVSEQAGCPIRLGAS